mgnify:CR=1 FL=1
MKYHIETADNGWIVEWWEESDEGNQFEHRQVFEIPDDVDTVTADPQALIDLLYFVKEEICGQCHSKHKKNNVMIRFEPEEEVA